MSAAGLIIEHGQIGGKTTTKLRPVVPKGKRTLAEQLVLEFKSHIKKKRDKGYHRPDETPPVKTLPMLAHEYDATRIQFPNALQEKLNGVRCVAQKRNGIVKLTGKKGLEITSMDHIVRECELHMAEGATWDGEIFNRHYSLQQISGMVRRKEYRQDHRVLEYWVYDRPDQGTFRERFMDRRFPETNILRKVPTFMCHNMEALDDYYNSIVNQGGEGIIIRVLDSLYQWDKRPWDCMKRKDFKDSEFRIIGFKRDVDGCVIWVCEIKPYGDYFDVVPMGTKESRKISDEEGQAIMGEYLTVRYSELSDDGIPQGNPVGLCIRNYE